MTAAENRLVLIDGYAQIYRAFHAIPVLTDAAGAPTNAVFGVARFLLALEQAWPHGHAAFVMDRGAPQARLDLLPQYKANRPPMPDALRTQLPTLREWVEACGYPILEKEGVEADDLIAGIVGQTLAPDVLIVSPDKDLGQLVRDPGVAMLVPGKKGAFDRLGEAEIEAKFGVPCRAIPDWLALVGDTADNIPGIPGIGAKTAAGLLRQFGSANEMLLRLAEVERPRIRQALADHEQRVQDNLKLVALQAELTPDWLGAESVRRRQPDWDRLAGMAERLGFKSLLKTLHDSRQAYRSPMLF